MSIFHLNVQGLHSKVGEIEALHFDHILLCFSEHFYLMDEILYSRIENFTLVAHYSRTQIKQGGVAIFCREDKLQGIHPIPINAVRDLSSEGVCELCAVESKPLNLLVVTLYRPPYDTNLDSFMEILFHVLEYVTRSVHAVIITGDFNIDVRENKAASISFLDLIGCFDFSAGILEPTRVNRCLDNFITNLSRCYFDCYVNDYSLSDHCAITCQLCVIFTSEKKNSLRLSDL